MIINVLSSHGSFKFDSVTGVVVNHQLSNTFGDLPYKVDVYEYFDHYGVDIASYPSLDVLDIGYWTLTGLYEEPAHDWRAEVETQRIAP
jgi:hypothetical protein